MSELVVPETVAAQLQGVFHPIHLCDSSGKRLGRFVPELDLSEYEIVGPEPTEEELREIEQSTEWYSTDEVLQYLEKLQ
jgi:hypothetical protein